MSYIGNEPIVSATRTITEITATAGQTVFVANGGYTVGYIDVFVNGVQLQTSNFTATNGSSVTLSDPAQVNDAVRLVAWGNFSLSNVTSARSIANTGGWNITPSGTKLILNYNGTNVGSLDSSGNFIVTGNVTAYGTP